MQESEPRLNTISKKSPIHAGDDVITSHAARSEVARRNHLLTNNAIPTPAFLEQRCSSLPMTIDLVIETVGLEEVDRPFGKWVQCILSL